MIIFTTKIMSITMNIVMIFITAIMGTTIMTITYLNR